MRDLDIVLVGGVVAAGALAVILSEQDRHDTDRPPSSFGMSVLAVAIQDLEEGFTEEFGSNDGARIRELFLNPLGFPPGTNYCALAVMSWIRRAEQQTGHFSNVTGSPGAKATLAMFEKVHQALRGPTLEGCVQPGDLLVFDRSLKGPGESGFEGHIVIVESVHGDLAEFVNANAAGQKGARAVTRGTTTLVGDPDLLGVCWFA